MESQCEQDMTLVRKCSTFTSCLSCLSPYPTKITKCHWCRCVRESGQCYSENDECDCKRHTSLSKCYEVFCEGSSCQNCRGNCIWTSYLQYKSESRRLLNNEPLEYNCFLRSLVRYLPPYAVWHHQDSCPSPCEAYTSCSSCLHGNVHGIDGGHAYCMWSDKMSRCLSPATLLLMCSFGRCGQLYTPNMRYFFYQILRKGKSYPQHPIPLLSYKILSSPINFTPCSMF